MFLKLYRLFLLWYNWLFLSIKNIKVLQWLNDFLYSKGFKRGFLRLRYQQSIIQHFICSYNYFYWFVDRNQVSLDWQNLKKTWLHQYLVLQNQSKRPSCSTPWMAQKIEKNWGRTESCTIYFIFILFTISACLQRSPDTPHFIFHSSCQGAISRHGGRSGWCVTLLWPVQGPSRN